MSTLSLSRGLVAIIDDADLPKVLDAGPWHYSPGQRTGYAYHNVRKPEGGWTTQSLHQFLTGYPICDHVNGDGLDNRRANLRPATCTLNAANRPPRKDSRSGYRGVFPNGGGRPWRAQICVDGRKRHLGVFDSPEQAAIAYDSAAREAWGEFARLNLPEGSAA